MELVPPKRGTKSKIKDWCKFHTDAPQSYPGFDEWARQMGKTHHQVVCPYCGLYHLWILK